MKSEDGVKLKSGVKPGLVVASENDVKTERDLKPESGEKPEVDGMHDNRTESGDVESTTSSVRLNAACANFGIEKNRRVWSSRERATEKGYPCGGCRLWPFRRLGVPESKKAGVCLKPVRPAPVRSARIRTSRV